MYCTSSKTITKADMDGSNAVQLFYGLGEPIGIAIDFSISCLLWTELNTNAIRSSNLAGRDVRTVVQLPANSSPTGLAIHGNKLYFGTH